MPDFQRILCPIDFSTPSEVALNHARSMARSFGAELHILHAVVIIEEPLDGARFGLPTDAEVRKLMVPMAERRMLDAVGDSNRPDNSGIAIHREIREASSAVPAILDYADEIEADLIVAGSYGRRGASRLLLGSVTELVVRHAACPVLTLHADNPPKRIEQFERILVPVDFSPHSREAISIACELAARSQARVLLVHAVETSHLPEFYGLHGLDALTEAVTSEARRHLEDLAMEYESDDVLIDLTVELGSAAPVVARLSAEGGVDLVVLSSHGRTGLRRVLLGSTAEQIVRSAEAPVLTVKSFSQTPVPKGFVPSHLEPPTPSSPPE